ncbi:MAG: O-antigen ligase family protein [Chloroflexi bacterium]|nr:O-antigen ligase family protein [Chloroflexota bacterium]
MPVWLAPAGAAVIGGTLVGLAVTAVNPLIVVVALLAAAITAAAFALPTGRFWLLLGVITLLPFATVPKIGLQPTFLDLILGVILLIAAARFLTRRDQGVATPLDIPVLVYLALCCVSFVFGSAYGLTTDTAKYFLRIVGAVLLFFAVTNGLNTRKRLNTFVNALIAGSAGSAVLALVFFGVGQPTAAKMLSSLAPLGYPSGDVLRFIASTTIWRATSTQVDPNIFGGLLMLGMIFLLGRLLESVADRRRWYVAVPGLAIMGWALLQSYSRGAWVGLVAGVVFLALARFRKALPVILLTGLIAVVALGNTDFGKHLVSGFLVEDKASAMRLGEYKDAVNFIGEYPFFGVGFGTTPSGSSAITPEADIYVGVSNIYLLMALEIGLVGMAGFALVTGTAVFWGWRSYRSGDPAGRNNIATAGAALFAAGVAGIADHYFFRFPHMIALFWSLIAILAISSRLAKGDPARFPG